MITSFVETIRSYLRAAVGGVQVVSRDETELIRELVESFGETAVVHIWSLASGSYNASARSARPKPPAKGDTIDDLLNDMRQLCGEGSRPRVVLILGADDVGAEDPMLRRALIEQKFGGGVYPINPKGGELLGHRFLKSLDEAGGPIDVALIVRPAPEVLPAVTGRGPGVAGHARLRVLHGRPSGVSAME